MAKSTTKRPSEERTHAQALDVSDRNRVPVPTVPRPNNLAWYSITPLGHVYRCDGRLVVPHTRPDCRRTSTGATPLMVAFSNRYWRPLAKLVFLAFGHPKLIERWQARTDLRSYSAWVDPTGPIDPLTKHTRCTVHDVVLVPHGELISLGQKGYPVRTRLSILSPL